MDKAFEDEVEPTVSIQEYLKGVEEEELEADLVLGGDEGKECTYNKGYMKRQAIFSCLTCTPDGTAGVCTACSLSCHDGHEVVELWTKRNFRCDCGNSKFGEIFCKLCPSKDIENVLNSYNHNFKGLYCTCGRPYPDPDAEEQEEMIQCCICEDWFHEEHIGLESSDAVPRDNEGEPLYEEFICQSCSASCSFLSLYPETLWESGKKCAVNKDKDVLENTSLADPSEKLESDSSGKNSEEKGNSSKCTEDVDACGTCVIGVDLGVNPQFSEMKKPLFLSKSWRETLCRCEKCVEFYRKKNISFLIDKEDSIAEYEKMAKQKREEKLQQQEGAEINLFSGLGHVEKIEILNGIADMKNEISAFFESSDPSKPITSADIQQVFENLAKKRRRE